MAAFECSVTLKDGRTAETGADLASKKMTAKQIEICQSSRKKNTCCRLNLPSPNYDVAEEKK
ncbi:MAG TPA: hypothetical protein PKV86_04685, partial [Syntrophobacteraceae bacterium]|nr:hypothetical protein [Syntrophobacteraceae bacterium]